MSYTRIFKIEEELRSLKVITPDDIEDAKYKLLNFKNQNQINEEELKNTKIKFQSQLASPPALSNSLTISAIVLSVLTGAFSLSTADTDYLAFLYLFLILSIAGMMLYFNLINSKTYKKCVTSTIMVSIIDEILLKK